MFPLILPNPAKSRYGISAPGYLGHIQMLIIIIIYGLVASFIFPYASSFNVKRSFHLISFRIIRIDGISNCTQHTLWLGISATKLY